MLFLGPDSRPPAEAPDRDRQRWLGHVKAAPTPALARYVDYYWISRWDRRGQPGLVASALLDPCVHLQVQDGRAHVVGVVRGTFQVPLKGASAIVGVRFRPGGFYPFVRQRVARWTHASTPAEEVFGEASGVYVGVSPAWVIRRYRLLAAARRLIESPATDMSTLAHEMGYSDQAHFIRAFRDTIGMTPGAYVKERGRG